MAGPIEPLDHVRQACEIRGLDSRGAQLIHHYSNAVVLIPREQAVARVATGHHDPGQVRRSLEVADWLTQQHDYPTVVPLPDVELVELHPEATVSFWVYYPQPLRPVTPTSADLGRLLSRLHKIGESPIKLPKWEPLTSLEGALRGTTADIITSEEHRWLSEKIRQVRDVIAQVDTWPLGTGLIHGDAWAGNLLPTQHGILLGDWDRVGHGPREVDLIPTWHASRRYGRDATWTAQFVSAYDYDLSDHPMLEALLAMRDLAQIPGPLRRAPHSAVHAAALRERLADIRQHNHKNQWIAL